MSFAGKGQGSLPYHSKLLCGQCWVFSWTFPISAEVPSLPSSDRPSSIALPRRKAKSRHPINHNEWQCPSVLAFIHFHFHKVPLNTYCSLVWSTDLPRKVEAAAESMIRLARVWRLLDPMVLGVKGLREEWNGLCAVCIP